MHHAIPSYICELLPYLFIPVYTHTHTHTANTTVHAADQWRAFSWCPVNGETVLPFTFTSHDQEESEWTHTHTLNYPDSVAMYVLMMYLSLSPSAVCDS